MGMSQSQLLDKFESGATRGSASHMFIDGDTLYSYGSHFPLLIRRDFGYLLNADKYSVTTSSHQSLCRHIATVVIPFSALRNAGIKPHAFNLIHKDRERIDTRQCKDKDGNIITVEERRPESCIIWQDDRYYLSSMDIWQYFIVELPQPCDTCQQAFDMLVPPEVRGKEYQRQGEWFIIKAEELPISLFADGAPVDKDKISKLVYKAMLPRYVLPHRDNGNPHTATRGMFANGIHYISGRLRHPQHRMLRLSKSDNPQIFEAYENTALNSWSANGNVD